MLYVIHGETNNVNDLTPCKPTWSLVPDEREPERHPCNPLYQLPYW
jgi:hypothetical protein